MNIIKPKFFLVGSIPERTRIGHANELDIVMRLQGLKHFPFVVEEDDAMKLKINNPKHPLIEFRKRDNTFNFERFFIEFHHHIKEALYQIINKQLLEPGLTIGRADKFCDDCRQLRDIHKVYAPYKHCKNCLFPVTHTKVGPCLIFQWQPDQNTQPSVITVDLVPVFPIKSENKTILDWMNCVTKTLITNRPPFWLDYFYKFINTDR